MLTGRARDGVPMMHPNMHLLAQVGGEQVMFFFAPQVNFDTLTVPGYTYSKQNGWTLKKHTLPKVIFHNALSSDQPSLQTIRKLRNMEWYMFNQPIGNKWRMTQTMRKWAPLAPHIPDTDYLLKPEEIDQWLERYPAVYLKPLTGSGGNGIMRVTKTQEGDYDITGETEALMTKDAFHSFIHECRANDHYLLQREIKLFAVENRKIDLRVFIIRDGDNKWRAISTVAKLGADDKIVTNLAAGGEMKSLDWVAEQARLQGVPVPTQEQIERVAIASGDAIMEKYPKVTHLGIDVALDYNGDLWLLDLNPSPTRKTLSEEQKIAWYHHMVAFAYMVEKELS